MRRLTVIVLAVASTAAALGVAQAARTDSAGLTAISGTNDSYAISLTDSSGAAFDHVAPGTFNIAVHDGSTIHNFHLVGPGVDKATSVLATGDFTWSATLANGYYPLAPSAGLAVLCVYAIAALTLAAYLLRRRDA